MNSPAIAMAEHEAISLARAALAANRALTGDEQDRMRGALWRFQDAGDTISLATLRAICVEIDRRADDRSRAAVAAMNAEAAKERADHLRARPARWSALPLMAKAMFYAAADREIELSERRMFLRLASIIADPNLAESAPPPSFEAPDFGARR